MINISGKQNGERDALYPNKMFSLSDFYLPKNIHEIFQYCRKLVATNEIISAIVHKMAQAPVTELVYDHSNETITNKYKKHFEEDLEIRERLLEIIVDLITYSNALITYEVPVTRYLVSPTVHEDVRNKIEWMRSADKNTKKRSARQDEFDRWYAEKANEGRNPKIPKRFKATALDWKFQGNSFRGKCPISGKHVKFERVDRYYASAKNVNIKRWDPNRIEIHHSELPGVPTEYFYKMKKKTQELIKKGDRTHLANAPWPYIVAAKKNKNVKIKKENLYHISNVKISGLFDGWGVPRLYSAFKLIWYYMILLQANEAIAAGKIHDLNILYPETNSRSGSAPDPAGTIQGGNFRRHVKTILKKHQKDPNFTGISPYPIGVQSIFGRGKMQLISNELQPIIRSITTAMGLPYDMLFGGGNYSQTAVANRIFSAQAGLHKERFDELLDFLVGRTSAALGESNYPSSMDIRLKDHEGPDAVQEKQMLINLAMNNQASRKSALSRLGLDWSNEKENMIEEAKDMAEISKIQAHGEGRSQAKMEEIVQRSKIQMQEEMQEAQAEEMQPQEGVPQEGGNEIMQRAEEVYEFMQENPDQVDGIMNTLKQEEPQVFNAVLELAQSRVEGEVGGMDAPGMDAPNMERETGLGGTPQGVEQGGGQQVSSPTPEARPSPNNQGSV